ncbi:efflux RND transporter permease subunit [Sanyastnella coralliicola]|uniref:efflux RND transporter permease subunit n=1 Tax=Sanyastnella coralliicola TaxID=3069118 RepID=UPI0027B95559|nr:efflux RND transporter permease subunit [Longitalea sp. SCSIO 12813]
MKEEDIIDQGEGSNQSKEEKLKEFGLTTFSISNRTTVFVITFIIFAAGLYSYITVPKESFPEVVIPEIYVGTPYPGNGPTDIEKLITRPLEKEINTITGIDEIVSTSTQGYSAIQVKFDFDVTPEEALRKVKDKVDVAMSDPDFPDDLPADPNIFEMNFSELVPVMNVNLSGDYSLDDLKAYAEILEDRIENVPEISSVDIRGVMDKEVEIEVDFLKAEAMNISFNDISGAIQQENLTISGGDVLVDNFKRTLQVKGEFQTMRDIERVIVKSENQNVVFLGDIAKVEFVEEEKESFAREYLQPVVSLDIIKRAGENLIEASDQINEIIDEARLNDLPENLSITITNDQSDQTRTQVDELQNSIIFGVILVVGVLLFFLGLRNALFVGVAIPLSMFMSFMILNVMGITFNVMVLFSLVLALGMLVDNGIVVVENIYRLMDEKGMNAIQAARYGVGEVAWPIIASTATTLAAFIPLAIWPGMMGEFMKYLPMTLIIVLSSSLFVALVINPALTAVFMRVGEQQVNKRRSLMVGGILTAVGLLFVLVSYGMIDEDGVDQGVAVRVFGNMLGVAGALTLLNTFVLTPAAEGFQNKVLPRLESAYERFLTYAVSGIRPWVFFFGTIGMLFLSFILMGVATPKVEFFPANEPQYLNIFIEKPIGTSIDETNRVTELIEQRVINVVNSEQFQKPDPVTGEVQPFLVNSVIGQVGNGTSDPNQGPQLGNTPHKARITVSFIKFQERQGLSTNDVLNAIREDLKSFPEAEIVVAKNENGPPQGPPINIEIKGDDYDSLMHYAQVMKRFINDRRIAGIEELKLDVNKSKPEMPVTIDREKARRYGLSTYQVGDAIRTALFGREVSTFKDGEDDYPINIRFSEEYRNNPDALLNQKITFRDPANGQIKQVPISSVATIGKSNTFNAVKRIDLERVITISSNVLEDYNANEIVNSIKGELQTFEMPDGITWEFTGQQEEQAKEMAFLVSALLIAFFMIFLIITAQFNSISTPFIIGFSVLFSMIGVLLGLVVFQMDFVILMTMIGIISLAGVVVNNAIVLIDYTNLIRDRRKRELGLPENERLEFKDVVQAIIEGGKTRLRPVLLTAITTILGLLPLAVGLNIDFVGFMVDYDPKIYVGGDNNVFWKPMSWAIIFGLTFATFLTLVIVPIMYWYLNRMKYKMLYKKAV